MRNSGERTARLVERAATRPAPRAASRPASGLLFLAIVGLSFSAAADESIPQPKRTLLERHPQAGVSGKEIVIGTAALPPGSALPFHTHPGDEIGYVLKGSVIWRRRGQPDRTLKAGDSFFNPRGSIHTLAAAADGEGGTVVSTWIVDADQEMSTPVP